MCTMFSAMKKIAQKCNKKYLSSIFTRAYSVAHSSGMYMLDFNKLDSNSHTALEETLFPIIA